jgi:hypothetical protein
MPVVCQDDGERATIHDRLGWLEAALRGAAGERVLAFSHVPMMPPRDLVPPDKVHLMTGPPWPNDMPPAEWQAYYYAWSEEEGRPVRDAIARAGNVVAHYSGHAHVHAHKVGRGTHYVVTGALASVPWEYRYVRVYDDRIEHSSFSPVPEALKKHPVFYPGCVDPDHPTVETYHRGNDSERDFTIDFRKDSR